MIGGGIFATLGLSLQLADGAAPIAFIFAGIIALITSYSYAKLSARYPSMGGTIEFLVRAFGDSILTGGLNVMLLASYIVMIALYAHAFGAYGASLIPNHYMSAYIILAIIAIGSLTYVNMLGAVISGRVELGLVIFKLIVLIFISIIGFKEINWQSLAPRIWPPIANVLTGGMIIFLAYEGFELIANTAMDAENTTIVRRALYSAVGTVISIYVLIALVSAGALSLEIIEKARDYALAILVKPELGEFGVSLVVAAALASTSSAINATLYGTARMSYLVAKYGEIPRVFEHRIWRGSYEGLVIISVLSLLLALGAGLEAISAAGSGGFLIIFAFVNYSAYKLRRNIGANPLITVTGVVLNLLALSIMIWKMLLVAPRELSVLISLVFGSIIIEYIYRRITGRKIKKVVDPKLREREHLLMKWEELSIKIAHTIKRTIYDAEVYIIGSHARKEPHRAGDIDILVITKKTLTDKEKKRIIEEIEKKLLLPPHHPFHIHVATEKEKRKYRHKKHL